ncbi:hypothetical protein ABLO27_21680 [Roseibium sp. SCPC15]|uniref:hypothetical protein n=1 Tax=Roseibium sp. SCP15 TaxID=3141376 RepID=UPI0033362456
MALMRPKVIAGKLPGMPLILFVDCLSEAPEKLVGFFEQVFKVEAADLRQTREDSAISVFSSLIS